MSAIPPTSSFSFHRWVDSLGSAGAMVCALHCAALPLFIAALPALGLGILASAGFENWFVACATSLAIASLWQGFRRHRVYRALVFLVPGLLAVWLGVLMPTIHHDVILHAIAMSVGGTLIAVAHLINLRLTHGHVHDAGCSHSH